MGKWSVGKLSVEPGADFTATCTMKHTLKMKLLKR